MSSNFLPIIVDLAHIKSLMGSKDTALLQAVIKKNRKGMLSMDEGGDYYDDFEQEIKAEYKAFAAGDFSSVNLNATYPERVDEDEGDDDEELTDIVAGIHEDGSIEPKAKQKIDSLVQNAFDGAYVYDGPAEDETPEKELTTGAALVHMILGGKPDPSQSHKYAVALEYLCKHFGEVPKHDSWGRIRVQSFHTVDTVLKKLGISPATFSTSKFLLGRGVPVAIPATDVSIGYLDRQEMRQILKLLDPSKLDVAIESNEASEWLKGAVSELREWMETCAKTDRDLVCFTA